MNYKISHCFCRALLPDATAVAAVACKLALPLEGGFYCSVNATILRSTLNTITVHLKPEMLVVNKCPFSIRLVEMLGEEEVEERGERIIDLSSMGVSILVNRQVGGSSINCTVTIWRKRSNFAYFCSIC